jgi:hypothetical protein
MTQSGHWRGIVKQDGKSETAQTVLVMCGRTELAASADTPHDALAPTTPSGGIETAADNAGAIAISRIAVAGAIAISRISRIAVAGAIAISRISRIAVAGAIAIIRIAVAGAKGPSQ